MHNDLGKTKIHVFHTVLFFCPQNFEDPWKDWQMKKRNKENMHDCLDFMKYIILYT